MSHLCKGPVCPAAWHNASWNWNWMMKLMKYLEWREGVGKMPRVQERGTHPLPVRPSLPTVTGNPAEQYAARVSLWPLVSHELFPDVPIGALPTPQLPTFLLQGDPRNRHGSRLMRKPIKLLQAVWFPTLEQRPGLLGGMCGSGRAFWVGKALGSLIWNSKDFLVGIYQSRPGATTATLGFKHE